MTDAKLDDLRKTGEAAIAIVALRAERDHLLRCVKAADDVTSQSAFELMRERAEAAEADNAALRQLLAELKPQWDAYTNGRIWTADIAGVMADLRRRLDAAMLAEKKTAPASNPDGSNRDGGG